MGIFYLILSFILGIVAGSFVNAAVYRIHEGMTLFRDRSICPNCKKRLRWWDNVPLLSYLVLRGKCRDCKQKISLQYPIVELVSGILFAGSFYYFFGLGQMHYTTQDTFSLVVRFVFITILLILFLYDLWYMELPDKVVLVGIGIAAVADLIQIGLAYLQARSFVDSSVLGKYLADPNTFVYTNTMGVVVPLFFGLMAGLALALIFYVIVVLSKERAMGGGDIKLAVMLGLMLPWPYMISTIYVGFVLGAVVGVALVLLQRKKMHTLIPLAPFLITGVFASMFFGPQIMSFLDSFKPF